MQDTDPAPGQRPLTDENVAAWLRLARTPGVGRAGAATLLGAFGHPQAIFEAGAARLAGVVPSTQARALGAPLSDATARLIDSTLSWLALPGNHLLTLHCPAYPALLRAIDDAPLLLYIKGRPALLQGPLVAIVGSRNASVQGQANARAFGQALSQAGLGVVSGLALGIDAAAHEGALRGAAGTVAVIGTGADRIYPARNSDLARRIAAEGCIVSEYPLGTPPRAENFPQRNRIISGLAAGVLVVEAAAQSGSLITAKLAAEQGRDVFALPGSIHSALAKGCHQLIREGAQLVESVDDVLQALRVAPLVRQDAAPAAPPPADAGLLDLLGADPLPLDALAARAGMAPGALSTLLLALELGGLVARLPGNLVQRIHR